MVAQTMKTCLLLILLAGTFFAPASAVSQEMNAEKMLSFADSLFDKSDYYRAITEYERLIFHYPKHSLAKTARFKIAMAYLKGGKLSQAAILFRTLAKDHPNDEIGREAVFMLAETYFQKREYPQAIDAFERFLADHPGHARADAARLKMGMAYLRQGKWQYAADEFRKVPGDSSLQSEAQGMADDARGFPDLSRKSPYVAGGLSAVLPGAGQLYVGRPADATVSFVLNGLFIWATADAFRKDNNVTGGILLFFESGWYLGNIYNAISSAHKYNRQVEQQFFDSLQNRVDLSYSKTEEGENLFLLTWRF